MQIERMRRVTVKEPLEKIRRNTQAPEGAFGVVDKSGMILADAAQDAAAKFAAVAQRRQDEWDKAKVNEAINSLYSEDQKLRFDPEKGLLVTVNGASAKGLYDDSDNMYAEIFQNISGKLENDRQRKLFKDAAMPVIRSARTSISQHEAQEVRKYTLEQNELAEKNAGAAFARSFKTTDGAQAALNAAQQSAITEYGESAVGFNVPDYSKKYNTVLSEEDEKSFQEWLKSESAKKGRDVSKDLFDYDLRGLFKEQEAWGFGENGHASDKFKKPNHPTFSSGSVYSSDSQKGGEWTENNGKWSFNPSATNISMQSVQGLKEYFSKAEPEADLNITEAQAASREPLNSYVKEKMARITSYALDTLINENPEEAQILLKSCSGYFDGVTYEKIKNTVDKATLPVKAQKLYTEVGGDFTKGIQYIQENVEPGQHKEYISAFKQEFTTQEAIKQDQRDKISDIVVEMSNTKTNYSQIKNYIKQNEALLGPKEFRTLNEFIDRDYERGKYTPKPVAPKRDSFHDLLMWTQAKEELVSGKYSSANEFLKAYKGVLPPGTLRSLANAAFYGKDPKTSAKDPYDRYNPLTTVGAMISDYQIDKDPREEQDFWAVFSDEAHVLETKNKRKLTAEEIEGIAKDLLKKTVLKKDYNNVEKIAMGLGIGKNWFEPDVTTEGYVYQEKAAYKNGIGYDVGTDTYYQIDEKGNITGWLPDSEPKLKAKDKRKIQGPGFYDE